MRLAECARHAPGCLQVCIRPSVHPCHSRYNTPTFHKQTRNLGRNRMHYACITAPFVLRRLRTSHPRPPALHPRSHLLMRPLPLKVESFAGAMLLRRCHAAAVTAVLMHRFVFQRLGAAATAPCCTDCDAPTASNSASMQQRFNAPTPRLAMRRRHATHHSSLIIGVTPTYTDAAVPADPSGYSVNLCHACT